jgi:hypothetical protein
VTYADVEHVESREVRGGKVTSEPENGYYDFWVKEGKQRYYVQTPIARSYIEEIPWYSSQAGISMNRHDVLSESQPRSKTPPLHCQPETG